MFRRSSQRLKQRKVKSSSPRSSPIRKFSIIKSRNSSSRKFELSGIRNLGNTCYLNSIVSFVNKMLFIIIGCSLIKCYVYFIGLFFNNMFFIIYCFVR